ncbi:hypothetical protein [Pantoea sp.]|uniref:hypothetical protein n=1 Tax=Pantoea sp. TaxID=69393 RepID=UPI0028A89497|nr:hypothetical protein [Pantoea sp.]
MHGFEHVVAEVKAELALRGLENSSLIFNKLAAQYAPYYPLFEPDGKEALLMRLKKLERSIGLQNKFDWECALTAPKK